MRLIEGKFYEGDRVIPIEFGNKEQIKLINEAKRTMDELTGDGMVVYPDIEEVVKVSVSIKCVCGGGVYFHDREIGNDDDVIEEMQGNIASCGKCRKKYVLDVFGGDLVVKLKQ